MAKFSISQLMNNKTLDDKETHVFKIEHIPIEKIKPSDMNKYSVDDVTELKNSIEMSGLQQNLLVRENKIGYEILAGHRRFKAMTELNKEGVKGFKTIPCRVVENIEDMQAELELLLSNSTARQLSDYEKMYQATRIKELLLQMKKSGFKFIGRMRDIVAEMMNVSTAQVGRMESINNNLNNDFKSEFKDGNISITSAYELSKLETDKQEVMLSEFKDSGIITPKKIIEKKKEIIETEVHISKEVNRKIHELKILPNYFNDVSTGLKAFEVRFNDRGYEVGHILRLKEFIKEEKRFSGEFVDVEVTYILNGGSFGVKDGYVVMGIRLV